MFNDVEKIKTINSITLPEVEILYWKLEDYLSSGDIKKARIFFDMFCYMAIHRKQFIKDGLKKCHRDRLREINYEMHNKDVPCSRKPIIELNAIKPVEIPFSKEKQINDYLFSNQLILVNALKTDGKITGREIPVNEYFCDITFENQSVFYVIELKKDQSNHQAVSQLDKYCHYFYLKLRYGLYKKIQGVIIANGFCSWSINEFHRKDRLTFVIKPTDKSSIILQKV